MGSLGSKYIIQANIKPMPTRPNALLRILLNVRSGRSVGLSIPSTIETPRPMTKKCMT